MKKIYYLFLIFLLGIGYSILDTLLILPAQRFIRVLKYNILSIIAVMPQYVREIIDLYDVYGLKNNKAFLASIDIQAFLQMSYSDMSVFAEKYFIEDEARVTIDEFTVFEDYDITQCGNLAYIAFQSNNVEKRQNAKNLLFAYAAYLEEYNTDFKRKPIESFKIKI